MIVVSKLDHKMRTCQVCFREYCAERIGKSRFLGTCPYCNTTDYALGPNSRGRLVVHDHETDEDEYEYQQT
jgi:hypothetical protein